MTTIAADSASEREAQAIRDRSARWLAAVDRLDADHAAAFYAEEGVFLVPNVPAARGREQVAAAWAQLLGAPGLALGWTPTSVEVARAGDLAYELGTYRLGMDGPAGRVEDHGKYVVVWRRLEGVWLVVVDIFNSDRPA
jgi:ketosteroid isomerase-like protein